MAHFLKAFARTWATRELRGLSAVWLVAFAPALTAWRDWPAQTAPAQEYQLKAVFLFNFAQFVEWPPQAFPDRQVPLVIGVLGEDPFGAYLDETVRDEKVNNRPLAIQRYRQVDEIKTCHVLFISRSEATRLEQILVSLKDRSILIVGDGDDFVQRGGMIRLANNQNK